MVISLLAIIAKFNSIRQTFCTQPLTFSPVSVTFPEFSVFDCNQFGQPNDPNAANIADKKAEHFVSTSTEPKRPNIPIHFTSSFDSLARRKAKQLEKQRVRVASRLFIFLCKTPVIFVLLPNSIWFYLCLNQQNKSEQGNFAEGAVLVARKEARHVLGFAPNPMFYL